MISCLTVTQEGKLDELRVAVRCFDCQTLDERELVIVHDGGSDFDSDIRELAALHPVSQIKIERVSPGLTLGALRNLSVHFASYELVCQWDDDDLYHPRRLEVQYEELRREDADFCFMTDQLHYFKASGEMYWDDWTVETYPMNLIQGTLMGKKGRLGAYDDLARGEDTSVVVELAKSGCRVAQLVGHGYLYIYVFNGKNAWDYEHHAAISAWKRLPLGRLVEDEAVLRAHLGEYRVPGKIVRMPHEEGSIFIQLGDLG